MKSLLAANDEKVSDLETSLWSTQLYVIMQYRTERVCVVISLLQCKASYRSVYRIAITMLFKRLEGNCF